MIGLRAKSLLFESNLPPSILGRQRPLLPIPADDVESLTDESWNHDDDENGDNGEAPRYLDWPSLFATLPQHPTSLLMAHYQSKIKTSPVNSFYDESVKLALGKIWFRTVFRCPLEGFQVASGVPREVVDSPGSSLDALTRNYFGGDFCFFQRDVYFSTKKAARKSCCLAALMHLDPTITDPRHFTHLVGTGLDAPQLVAKQVEVRSELVESQISTVQRWRDDSIAYPDWVHRFYQAGLTRISIKYMESRGAEMQSSENFFPPTLIVCQITAHRPVHFSVSGEAISSHELALESAVEKMMSELPMQFKYHGNQNNGCNELEESEMDTMQALYESLPSTTAFEYHLPRWTCTPFRDKGFLYELVFLNESGRSWIGDTMKLSVDCSTSEDSFKGVTRVGVIFPCDFMPFCEMGVPKCRSTFKSLTGVAVQVDIKNRTVIDLGKHDISILIQLNQTLLGWKQHLLGKNPLEVSGHVHDTGRTYLFVPLVESWPEPRIDWTCISDILTRRENHWIEKSRYDDWALSSSKSGLIVCALAVVITFGRAIGSSWMFLILFSILAILLMTAHKKRSPSRSISILDLKNRFLRHRGNRTYFYQFDQVAPGFTSDSKMMENGRSDDVRRKWTLEKFGVDLESCSFREFFLKRSRYDLQICFPHEPLLKAFPTKNPSKLNSLEALSTDDMYPVYLIPELTTFLALPRDFILVVDQAKRFMPEVERSLELFGIAFKFVQTFRSPCCTNLTSQAFTRFVRLIEEATTLEPQATYERLEFLGDAVLSYILALQGISQNSSLRFSNRELMGTFVSEARRNKTLADALLQSGLVRTIYSKRTSFVSAYRHTLSQNNYLNYEILDLPQTLLSDCFESVIAAAFLMQTYEGEGQNLVTTLLDRAGVPSSVDRSDRSGRHKFAHLSSLLTEFRLCKVHDGWRQRTEYILCRLRDHKTAFVDFSRKCNILLERMLSMNAPRDLEETGVALVLCAIYNRDDLTEGKDDQFDDGLQQLTLVRRMLFNIGDAAFSLMIALELFRRYPYATPGDLMLLVSTIRTDQVLAYLMIQNSLHETLFDERTNDAMLHALKLANSAGEAKWLQKGGWILPDGLAQFRERTQTALAYPRYPGIMGGIILGEVNLFLRELHNLSYAFKAIIGSFVLNLGVDVTWIHVRQLILELFLLSPDELRRECSASNIVVNYSSGRTVKSDLLRSQQAGQDDFRE